MSMNVPRKGVSLALEFAIVRTFNIGVKLLILCKPRQTVWMIVNLIMHQVIVCWVGIARFSIARILKCTTMIQQNHLITFCS